MSWSIVVMNPPEGARSFADFPTGYQPPLLGTRDEVIALLLRLDPGLAEGNQGWVKLPATGDSFSLEQDPVLLFLVRNPSDELIAFLRAHTRWTIFHAERGHVLRDEP
jgi:hypothetical protein